MVARSRRSLVNLRLELAAFYAFFYRSLVEQLSFRSWFAMRMLGTIVTVTTFGIFAQVVPAESVQADILQKYGIGGQHPMVTWFLLGMIVQNMVALGSTGISWLVNSPFYPYYHTCPTHLITILLGNSSFRYNWILIETAAYLAVGPLFGMQVHLNLGFILVVVTGILLIFALDLLSSGWNIITKMSEDPLTWFLNLFSQLVSGRMIPVWLLPGWIRAISYIHPQYYINEMARYTLGGNAPIGKIWPQLAPLLLLTAILLIVGYRSFKFGFGKSRDEGTLGHAMSGWIRPP